MLLSAQCHLGSKNMQVHMEPYLWKTRADGINVLNVGKTWYVASENMLRGQNARRRRNASDMELFCDVQCDYSICQDIYARS